MMRFAIPARWQIFLSLPCVFLAFSGEPAEAAVLEQYCQYPPYVIQSVLPSVTLLVSNSQSMAKFAYGDTSSPPRTCDNAATACGGFDPTKKYYGIFQDNSYYTNVGSNAAAGSKFTFAGYKSSPTYTSTYSKGNNDWDGNFLNWLTMRRIDVMKKVLTGGDGSGSQACGSVTEAYKEFTDNGRTYSIYNSGLQTVQFPINGSCAGALQAVFSIGSKNFQVAIASPGTLSGIIQLETPRASIGLAFYNSSDSQGASIDPQIDGSNLPISAYRNRID